MAVFAVEVKSLRFVVNKYTALAVALTSFFSPLQAENLIQLWGVAIEQDSKYQIAKHKFAAGSESLVQSRSQLLPEIAFQYEYKQTDQDINESDNQVYQGGSDKYSTKTMGVTLTQSIFDYSRWQRYYQSKASEGRVEVEFQLAEKDLMLRLSESYFLVLERRDQLETVQTEKAAMNKHLTLAEKKFKTGLGRSVDVEDARARYLNALSKEVELRSRLMDSRYALREIIGVIPQKLIGLKEDVGLEIPTPADAQAWVDMSLSHNFEIAAKRLAYEEAEKEVKSLRGGHMPTLDLVYRNNNVNTGGSVFGGGSDIDTADIVLQFNLPLYSGGQTSSRVRQALAKQMGAMDELNERSRNVERSTHDAFHRINAAIVQVESLAQSVKALERMLKTKTAGYRTGRSNILEVLDAQQDLSWAQQGLTKARYDYVLNVLRLRFLSGDLNENDLVTVNSWLVGQSLPANTLDIAETESVIFKNDAITAQSVDSGNNERQKIAKPPENTNVLNDAVSSDSSAEISQPPPQVDQERNTIEEPSDDQAENN